MNKIECPCINTVMVTHPFKRIPYDICPRDEIAAPYKLLAVAQTRPHSWDDIEINDFTYQRTWIQMRTTYPSLSLKIKSLGFYCATRDPSMFTSMLDVDDTHESILEWLRMYAKMPAIMTTPLMSYRTKYQEIIYYITNTFPQRIFVTGEHTDLTEQMIEHNAYTICNGLTLAIGMQRLGFWTSEPFQAAFCEWLEDQESIYTDITPDIVDLVVQHPIPQICDHPYYYAVMGRSKAHIDVIKCLHNSYEIYEPFTQQQDVTTQVITNATIQMMPYTPLHIFDYVTKNAVKDEDDDEPGESTFKVDLGGLMAALFTQKPMWNRWLKTYKETLLLLRDQSDTAEHFVYQCVRRSFVFYNKGSHVGRVYTSRIRKFWSHIIEVIDQDGAYMLKCTQKLIIHSFIHQELQKRGIHTQVWIPKIPVAFLMEMMRRYGSKSWKLFDSKNSVTILTSYDEVADIFQSPASRFGEFHSCVINKPLMSFMAKMKRGSTIHTFYRLMRQRAQERLRILRAAFMRPTVPRLNENEAYTVWTVLQDYFTDHKEALMA